MVNIYQFVFWAKAIHWTISTADPMHENSDNENVRAKEKKNIVYNGRKACKLSQFFEQQEKTIFIGNVF